MYSWSNTFATKNDLPLKFSRSAGTPLSLVSAISAAKFIILLSLTGLLSLADIAKKNQSMFTKILCLQNFSVRLMLCPCHINVFNEEKLKPTWCKSIRVYFVSCNLKILKRNRMIIFISLIFQSSCTTAHNPNHFRGWF